MIGHYFPELDGGDIRASRFDSRRYKGSSKSTTNASIAPELKPLVSLYTQQATNLANQPFKAYTGDRFADLNSYQTMGADSIAQRAMDGDATMNAGANSLQNILNSTTNNNPYLDSMVNRAQENVISNYNNATVGSGSFGNSGLQESLAKGLGDVSSSMYGNAYNTDMANKLQAAGMAPTYGNQAYTDAGQMIKAGQMLQDQSQQGLDFNYEQFQEMQNDPYKKLNAMSAIFDSNLGMTQTTKQSGGGQIMLGGLLNSLGIFPDILLGKKPEDAIRDNVIGVTGALMAPGLLESFGGANGAVNAVVSSTPQMSMASGPATWYGETAKAGSPQGGLLSSVSGYAKEAKPILDAGSTGMSIANKFNQQQHTQAPQMIHGPKNGSNALAQLYLQGQQYLAPLQQAQEARMQRRNNWG